MEDFVDVTVEKKYKDAFITEEYIVETKDHQIYHEGNLKECIAFMQGYYKKAGKIVSTCRCKAKKWFTLQGSDKGKPGVHGRDHSGFIITPEHEIWWYRRQDGKVELMMEFEHTAPKPAYFYKAFIGHVSIEEFEKEFITY